MRCDGGIKERSTLRDYLEVHFILELQTARLAARRRTASDIRDLWLALARRGEYTEGEDLDCFADRDQAVHEAVALASHNEVLLSVYKSMNAAFHRPYRAIFAAHSFFESSFPAHAKIIEAVIYGDEEAAVGAVRAMFSPLLERVTLLPEVIPKNLIN